MKMPVKSLMSIGSTASMIMNGSNCVSRLIIWLRSNTGVAMLSPILSSKKQAYILIRASCRVLVKNMNNEWKNPGLPPQQPGRRPKGI